MPSSVPPMPPQMFLAMQLEQSPPEPLPVELAFRWLTTIDRARHRVERLERLFFAADAESFADLALAYAVGILRNHPAARLTLQCDAIFLRPDGNPGREWRGVGPDAWPPDPGALAAELRRLAGPILARAVDLLHTPGGSASCAVA